MFEMYFLILNNKPTESQIQMYLLFSKPPIAMVDGR